MVLASLFVLGEGWEVEVEVFRNLGGGVGAWLVGAVILLIGVAILWGTLAQVSSRFAKQREYEPSNKSELVLMFVAVIPAGLIGAAAGRSLEWRLKWTSGVFLEGKLEHWEAVQGLLGCALAVSFVFTVWVIVSQILGDRRGA